MSKLLQPFILSALTFGAEDELRLNEAIENQKMEAMSALRASRKPLKFSRIAERFSHRVFKGVETWLRSHPDVKRTTHKGKIYYQYFPSN
jgi:hypothetical protein